MDKRTVVNRPPHHHYFNFKSGSILSNLTKCEIRVWDKLFISSEQAYQYQKAISHNRTDLVESILQSSDPFEIYKLGKLISTSVSWKKDRVKVMRQLLVAKYNQSSKFREELKATDRKVLVEDTPNEFWGRGKNNTGRNILGLLLMEIRRSNNC